MNLETLHNVQLPEGYAGNFVDDVRALVAKRLHLAPVLHAWSDGDRPAGDGRAG